MCIVYGLTVHGSVFSTVHSLTKSAICYILVFESVTILFFSQEDSTMRDVILAIRADEAHHRVVNHTLSSIHLDDQNPFHPGQRKL